MTEIKSHLREPFDLGAFGLAEMLRCGLGLRAAATGAATMEEAVRGMVDYLYDALRDPATGERSCALVRCFKTHAYHALEPAQQSAARHALGDALVPNPETRCLTLLASAGVEPEWRGRHGSRGHRAIPLASPEMLRGAPMIAQLMRAFGLDPEAVVGGRGATVEGRTYDVFHVPEAVGSPYIPAQAEFVVPYGVRSVLGFGGELPRGEMIAIILFSRTPIPASSAGRFRNIALDLKTAAFKFAEDRVFAGSPR